MNTKALAAVAIVLAGAAFGACGGDDSKNVKYPGHDDGGSTSVEGNNVTTGGDAGAVVGVTEGPSAHPDMSGDAKAAYDKGFQAWMTGDLGAAKSAFREATTQDPKAAAAYYSLGCVLERLGDNSGAQQAYRQAFSAKSDYELAMGAYALNLAHTGHQGEADTFLTDKHQKFPNSARVETYLAEVKSLGKDSGSAQQLAQDALRIDPNYKEAMIVIARDHYRNGRVELAKYALQAVLEGFGQASPARDPGNAEALLLRGIIAREAGQRIAALKDFDAARAKRPDLVEATMQVAAMKLEAGNAQEAQPLLESAVKFMPQSAIAHMNLGDCYRLLTRYADAKKEFDTALSHDSTLAGVHYDMGLMYLNAPSIPGMSAKDQVAAAVRELKTYLQMRGPKAPAGVSDDIDDLIAHAQDKQNQMNMATAAPAATTSAKKP
jgi:tetratricopeptide (TPR) repeat protein